MPKVATEIKNHLQIEANKGKVFCVGGVKGLKCDYRREKPCYFLQWTVNGKYRYHYLNTISLKEAKEKARKARALIDEGLDPNEIKRQEAAQKEELERKDRERKANTLKVVADKYFDHGLSVGLWKGKDQGAKKISRFRNHPIYKELAETPLSELTPQRAFTLFKDCWAETPSQADKIHDTLNQIYNYAVAYGLAETNPVDKKGPFGVLIGPITKARKKQNPLPAPNYQDIPKLLKDCIPYTSVSKKAFIFQVLTATRGEATRTLEWEDVDLEKKIITVKPENDKASKEFNDSTRPRDIYLSEQAIQLLKSIPRISKFVFPSREGGGFYALGNGAIPEFLKGMHQEKKLKDGIGWVDSNCLDKNGKPKPIVPHATARSTFKTWSQEMKHSDRATELCLLHKPKDLYDGAYNRAELVEERRQIMQQWADFCLQGIDLKELFS